MINFDQPPAIIQPAKKLWVPAKPFASKFTIADLKALEALVIISSANSAAAGGGGGLVWTFGGATTSYGSLTIPSGLLVVSVIEKSSPGFQTSAVSFNGTSLTNASSGVGTDPYLSVWYGVVTGATGALTVTATGGTIYTSAVSWGTIAGATTTPTSTQLVSGYYGTAPNVTITVPTNGLAITSISADRAVTGTWTGSTGDANIEDSQTEPLLTAHSTSTGSINPKFTGTAMNAEIISVAWGP
jgi:hypothetical protein